MMKTDEQAPFPVHKQLQILLEYGLPQRERPSLNELARATGMSGQACANLLQGKSDNPRLQTLQSLCEYFGVSLDYFTCASAAECRAYLYLYRLRATSSLLTEIESAAERLSSRGQRNVLAVMEWMHLAAPSGRKDLT